MAKIVWEGNQAWGKKFPDEPLPKHALKINRADNLLRASLPYVIPPAMVCFLAVFFKKMQADEFLFDLRFMPVGLLIGLVLAIPVHEYLHAICYPKAATVYVGLCVKKLAAYAVSFYPIRKGRYVLMSLLPAVLGILPLVIFLLCPFHWKAVMTICLMLSFMGLIAPSPDYMDVIQILRQVPNGAFIQASNDGLFWYR